MRKKACLILLILAALATFIIVGCAAASDDEPQSNFEQPYENLQLSDVKSVQVLYRDGYYLNDEELSEFVSLLQSLTIDMNTPTTKWVGCAFDDTYDTYSFELTYADGETEVIRFRNGCMSPAGESVYYECVGDNSDAFDELYEHYTYMIKTEKPFSDINAEEIEGAVIEYVTVGGSESFNLTESETAELASALQGVTVFRYELQDPLYGTEMYRVVIRYDDGSETAFGLKHTYLAVDGDDYYKCESDTVTQLTELCRRIAEAPAAG